MIIVKNTTFCNRFIGSSRNWSFYDYKGQAKIVPEAVSCWTFVFVNLYTYIHPGKLIFSLHPWLAILCIACMVVAKC